MPRKPEIMMATYDNRPQPLYGVVIHYAAGSGDLDEMKAVEAQAEAHLAADGDVAAELAKLKMAIAEIESGQE